jgi:Holliday junction resolvase RusA-like endonuclease
MKLFEIFVAMEPVAKGRPRVTGKGFSYTPTKTVKAEHRIQQQVANAWPQPVIEGPLAVSIVVQLLKPKSAPKNRPVWPIVRPDADNYGKLVLDALNGILWRDDSQVVDLRIQKVYAEHIGFGIEVATIEAKAEAVAPMLLGEAV